MKGCELFRIGDRVSSHLFLFREVIKTFDDVEVEATPNGVKMKASRRDMVPDAAQPFILEGN